MSKNQQKIEKMQEKTQNLNNEYRKLNNLNSKISKCFFESIENSNNNKIEFSLEELNLLISCIYCYKDFNFKIWKKTMKELEKING